MKKTIFSVALAAGFMVSCTSAPKVTLEGASKADSLAYAIGVAQTQGLQDYLVGRMGVDTTYMGQFVNGVLSGLFKDIDGKSTKEFIEEFASSVDSAPAENAESEENA